MYNDFIHVCIVLDKFISEMKIFQFKSCSTLSKNIVAAFRGMHVSPAKHSYAWLSRKCDYRTDRHTHTQTDAGQSDPYVPLCFAGDTKIVAAFRVMHVSPATHSFGKCDRRTDRQTDGQTDGRRTKWSLCVAMLRRRHNEGINFIQTVNLCFQSNYKVY